MSDFQEKLRELLNHYSKENESHTPDFILAEYLEGCLENFARTVRDRDRWYYCETIRNDKIDG